MKRILITGPESTGKTQLSRELALFYGGAYVCEYAREYILNLGRPYEYRDVVHVAEQQVREYKESNPSQEWLFFDTWLIVTKVWFEVVYGRCPEWLEDEISKADFDLVLVCDIDIPWYPDPVRENGGERREELLRRYKEELDKFGMEWVVVTGSGQNRIEHAKQLINRKMKYGTF